MEKIGLLGASKEKEEDSIRKLSSQMTDRKKEPIVKVQVRPRRGGKFIMEKWFGRQWSKEDFNVGGQLVGDE